MKKIVFLSLVIAIIIGSCAQQEKKFPQGAWKLVQVQRIANGKTRITFPTATNKGTQIKVLSEKHWANMGHRDRDTVIIDVYAGGTYTFEGKTYVEDVMYHNAKNYIGKKVKMSLELKNDTIYQTYNPINVNGQVVDSVLIVEKSIPLE